MCTMPNFYICACVGAMGNIKLSCCTFQEEPDKKNHSPSHVYTCHARFLEVRNINFASSPSGHTHMDSNIGFGSIKHHIAICEGKRKGKGRTLGSVGQTLPHPLQAIRLVLVSIQKVMLGLLIPPAL
jgi:hypothetical protein